MTSGTDGSDLEDRALKKRKKKIGRKLLSFNSDDDTQEGQDIEPAERKHLSADNFRLTARRVTPNPNTSTAYPKAITKASLAAEAAEREILREQYVKEQELVRDTDIAIPFVFYDGSNLPGGTVKIKKGEHIWLFLERCRKVGAEMGVSSDSGIEGGGSKTVGGKKSWARIGVDDLLLVRGRVIIPHHYEFYYFIANKIEDPNQPGQLLFNYHMSAASNGEQAGQTLIRKSKNEKVEGEDDDPAYTKIVDRRWYEKNKHIYPASLWREYKSGKEFEELGKGHKDAQGNAFFFS